MDEKIYLKCVLILILCHVALSVVVRVTVSPDNMKITAGSIKIPVGIITEHGDSTTFPIIEKAFRSSSGIKWQSTFIYFELINEGVSFNDVAEMDQAVCRLLARGVHALFAKTNVLSYQTLSSYANDYKIPLFSPSVPEISHDLYSRYAVSMQPQTTRAIINLLRDYPWHDIYYLYDDDNGPGKLQKIFQLSYSVHKINLLGLLKVSNAEEANKYLRKLQSSEKYQKFYVILDVRTSLAKDIIMRHVHDIHVGKINFHFLIANPVLEEFWSTPEFKSTSVNITGFVLPVDSDHPIMRGQRFEGWDEEESDIRASSYFLHDAALLLINSIKRLPRITPTDSRFQYSTRHRYAELSSRDCLNERVIPIMPAEWNLMDIIRTQEYSGNMLTGTVTFDEFNVRSKLSLLVLESTQEGQKVLGYWSGVFREARIPINKPAQPTALARIGDEKKKLFKVISMLSPPFLMLRSNENATVFRGNDRYEGFVKDLLDSMAQQLDFEYKIILPEDNSYGDYDEMKGEWTGIIGDIIRGKADMAVADLQITPRMQRVVDFLSSPISSISLSVLMKSPHTSVSSSPFYILSSFSADVWICIIVCAIVIIASFHVLSNFTGSPDNIEATSGIWGKKFTIMSSIWFILGSSVMHGTGIYPRSISCRILGGTWWCFTLVLLCLFIANTSTRIYIDSTNTEHDPKLSRLLSLSFDSVIKESLKNNWPHLGIIRDRSAHEYIKTSGLPTYKMLTDYFHAYPNSMIDDINYGVQQVQDSAGGYAFLMESLKSDYYSKNGPCNTISIHDPIAYADYGIAVPLGSYIRYDLNAALRNIKDSGELGHLQRKWWTDKLKCHTKIQEKYIHGSLRSMSGIFYLGVLGIFVASLVSISQYLWKAHKREERRQRLSFEEVAMNQSLPLPPPELLTDAPMDEDNGVIDGWAERKLVPTSFSKESRRSATNEESGVR